ncbi:hypothetical protein HBJ16_003372, partial [Pseudomonas sp. CES]
MLLAAPPLREYFSTPNAASSAEKNCSGLMKPDTHLGENARP